MSTEKRLTRSQSDKMLGGVCGGLGEYFDIDPTLVRIAFAGLVLVGVGSPILLYLLLWVIMPGQSTSVAREDGHQIEAAPVPAQLETRDDAAVADATPASAEAASPDVDQGAPEGTPVAQA